MKDSAPTDPRSVPDVSRMDPKEHHDTRLRDIATSASTAPDSVYRDMDDKQW